MHASCVPDNCSKLAAVVTRARVDPRFFCFFQLLNPSSSAAASLHQPLDASPERRQNLLFGRRFQHLIVLVPNENTMSQIVDKYPRQGVGTKGSAPWGDRPRGRPSPG